MIDVSKWLGHSSTSVTDAFYIHKTYEDKMETANAMNNIGLKLG